MGKRYADFFEQTRQRGVGVYTAFLVLGSCYNLYSVFGYAVRRWLTGWWAAGSLTHQPVCATWRET